MQCVCLPRYTGPSCSVPRLLETATIGGLPANLSSCTVRSRPRRIISALPFNHEFGLLEARLHDLHTVVDVFIIQESNFTNSGSENKLRLKQRLEQGGWQFRDKIVFIERTQPPPGGFRCAPKYLQNTNTMLPTSICCRCCSNGELADADMRRHLGREGLRRLTEVRLDDLYIYNDSDEIPRAELLLFLKLHDG